MPLYVIEKTHHVTTKTIMIVDAEDEDRAMVAVEDGDKAKFIAEGDTVLQREDIEAEAHFQLPMTPDEVFVHMKGKKGR